jgi:hypothetical protein
MALTSEGSKLHRLPLLPSTSPYGKRRWPLQAASAAREVASRARQERPEGVARRQEEIVLNAGPSGLPSGPAGGSSPSIAAPATSLEPQAPRTPRSEADVSFHEDIEQCSICAEGFHEQACRLQRRRVFQQHYWHTSIAAASSPAASPMSGRQYRVRRPPRPPRTSSLDLGLALCG